MTKAQHTFSAYYILDELHNVIPFTFHQTYEAFIFIPILSKRKQAGS